MKISNWLLAAGAFGSMVSAASAADLAYRKAPVMPLAVPGYSWSGFYIGANAGAGFGSNNNSTNSILLPANSVINSLGTDGVLTFPSNRSDKAFFVGGGQIGYNWQATPGAGFVFGLEADIQYVDMQRSGAGVTTPANYTFVPTTGLSRGLAFAPPPASVITNGTRDMEYLGTVRGRVGYAFDNLLLYGTGGFAYGGGADDNVGGSNDIRYGYAVGGGLEYGFSQNWSMKVEGLYVSLDRRNSGNAVGSGTFNNAANTVTLNSTGSEFRNLEFGLVRVGLNYKFGGPVVARY